MTDAILVTFGRRKGKAQEALKAFVQEGIHASSIWSGLNRQVYLGDNRFVERLQRLLGDERDAVQIPKTQRHKPPPTLEQFYQDANDRDAAIIAAQASGEYSYSKIGDFFDLHFSSVGRIVRKAKAAKGKR